MEDLARQYDALKRYERRFTELGLRSPHYGGHRFRLVNERLRLLLAQNEIVDNAITDGWRVNTERVTLFDRVYSVCTYNVNYRELLEEHKQLVARADRVFLADLSLKDAVKKADIHMARVRHEEQLVIFRRNCYIGGTIIGITSAALANIF